MIVSGVLYTSMGPKKTYSTCIKTRMNSFKKSEKISLFIYTAAVAGSWKLHKE